MNFLFHHLKLSTNKAPVTLQSSGKVKQVLEDNKDYLLIHLFEFLPTDSTLFKLVPDYMKQYNLLPNDAIILATCKIHGITQIASHDKDFEEA